MGLLRTGRDDSGVPEQKALQDIDEQIASCVSALQEIAKQEDESVRLGAVQRLLELNALSERMLKKNRGAWCGASSFRKMLYLQSRRSQISGYKAPAWQLNQKIMGHKFADLLGIARPRSQLLHDKKATISTIRERPGPMVVKPIRGAGSAGVFMVNTDKTAVSFRNGSEISFAELSCFISQYNSNEWIVEDFVHAPGNSRKPAHDVKFYCFYGQAPLALEIDRSTRPVKHCWWDRAGNNVETGKYSKSAFVGTPPKEAEMQLAESISSCIPEPFIRIDFLSGQEGLLFCEFTPRPGDFEAFDKRTDRALGDAFLAAEARLLNDLRAGKQFAQFEILLKG